MGGGPGRRGLRRAAGLPRRRAAGVPLLVHAVRHRRVPVREDEVPPAAARVEHEERLGPRRRVARGPADAAGDLPKPPVPPPPGVGQPGSDSNPGPSKGASYTSSSQNARGSKSKIKVTSMPPPPTNRCDRIIHNIREQLHKTQDLDEMDRKEIIRALMLKWHPDKQRTSDLEQAGDEEHSNEVFQYIQNAKKWYL